MCSPLEQIVTLELTGSTIKLKFFILIKHERCIKCIQTTLEGSKFTFRIITYFFILYYMYIFTAKSCAAIVSNFNVLRFCPRISTMLKLKNWNFFKKTECSSFCRLGLVKKKMAVFVPQLFKTLFQPGPSFS